MSDEHGDSIVDDFVIESLEHLADIENELLTIESDGTDGGLDLVNKVFRGIHSIKGAAGFLGFENINDLAHSLESVLNLIRNEELAPSTDIIDVMLRAADLLSSLVGNIHTSGGINVSALIEELTRSIENREQQGQGTDKKAEQKTSPEGEESADGFFVSQADIQRHSERGNRILSIEIDLFRDYLAKDQDFLDLPAHMSSVGEIIDSRSSGSLLTCLSNIKNGHPEQLLVLLASQLSVDALAAKLDLPTTSITEFALDAETSSEPASAVAENEVTKEAASSTPEDTVAGPAVDSLSKASTRPAAAAPQKAVEASIRVNVGLLDHLMNLAGELVLGRNQLIQSIGNHDQETLEAVGMRLDQVTSEMQGAIMQTRMQPIGNVFDKFPRVVRDLSKQLDKKADLELSGRDVDLDRTIIEAIGDPLTHLVRNSVDHGIEAPEDRLKQGKPEAGRIGLNAFHQAGKVNITISDDGGGINASKLLEKAVNRGIMTDEQAAGVSEREALQLIFHPGFSTAEKVTGVSGRGVGMDVVKTNIEKLGGTVGIETKVNGGTTINVKLPLTLAIVPSLIVSCAAGRFAIPQSNIRELVRIRACDIAMGIERVKDAEVFRLRGRLLPLVRLDAALGVNKEPCKDLPTTKETAVNIIVVEAGHLQYGLIVDGLHDSEEIVVKPLGRHMQDCRTLAGATILGDGQVAMILDVSGIATEGELTVPEDDDVAEHEISADSTRKEMQTSLLFTNHPDEQFGIPTASISRLERVRSDQIDHVGGMDVLQYRGVSLPILALEKFIKAEPRDETRQVYIVVFAILQREVGLIVPQLQDIRRISIDVDTSTFREPGVMGSVEVEGQATRLIDPYELTKCAFPAWFAETKTQIPGANQVPGFVPAHGEVAAPQAGSPDTAKTDKLPMILVVEDSAFFRRQVTGFIKEVGYDVIACEDGLVGWNTLQERGAEIDVVVTDIEMPNMDGCELAQRIKGDPSLCHLPIIALTSLASEEDMQRGMESGIDDYQVKLDRERLSATVARHVQLVAEREATAAATAGTTS